MIPQIIVILLTGIFASLIGALPFGLVNLSVMDVANRQGKRNAIHIAHGAAWVEVLFGLIAIVAGNFLIKITNNNQFIHYSILLIPAAIGFIFFFKKSSENKEVKSQSTGFLKGMFLNLISLQVLLYWIIAISFLNGIQFLLLKKLDVIIFLVGIWLGKMFVLWIYALISQKVYSKWQFFASNINRVIGSILLLTSLIQFLK